MNLPIDPGEFVTPLTVEKNTPVAQGDGTDHDSWAAQTPNPIAVKLQVLTGEELVQAQALSAIAKLRVMGWLFTGIEPMLYRFKRYQTSEVLEITHVNDHEERGVYMTVLCGEALG